ncbi:MipA/OmpV family protein [Zhongshania aquimaris]|uniref:MipA/OmpV family protein n=1 Tax=Zhongshania aquimaris TaxID=2857107 RepID=A0ABS6VTU6_9GAMM|nr:MipA/OmpV family protein [Zhongshania aquimaris]MBW2941141.1 MipA/OmpV family protein [Zhongshania aquimaris]
MRNMIRILLLSLLSIGVGADELERLPKWELGLGLAAVNLPDYPGADQSQSYVLPFPYVIYRGARLKAGREGLRGLLFESKRWDLDISAGGSLPVNSDDNRARQGMDDLKVSLELGPSLRLKFVDEANEKIQLRFNLRALLAADDFPALDYEGWLFNPELRWRRHYGDRYVLGSSLQVRYGSAEYHDYFYGVAPQFATATRPSYRANRGYQSVGVNGFMAIKIDHNWRLTANVGYYDLHNAAFDDSPLFKRNSGAYFGLSISRILWRSQATVGPSRIDDIVL